MRALCASFAAVPPIADRPCVHSYSEAAKIKQKADELEAWELEKWTNQKQAEMCVAVLGGLLHCGARTSHHHVPARYQKEMRFKHQLKSELVALKQRIQSGKDEQKKQRQLDLERLIQRYQNVKSELEQQQNLERIRAEKYWRSAAGGKKR